MLKPLRRSARLLKKREKLPLQLPLEVLELILEYSLPPCPPLIANISATSTTNRPLASWFIFPLRSEQLCAIALVSRQCRRWAQRELLRHIVLDSDEAVDRLLEAWEPLSVEERASRGIVTETLRIGHDDEDEPIRLGDRFERLLMLLQPDELVAVGTGLRELWFLSVTDVNLRSLARLQDLRLRFCDAMGVSTPMSTPPPGAIDMPYLPLLRTLVISLVSFETDEDEASPPIFPHHEFTNLEILSFDEFDALRAIFGCDSWMLPKLRAFQPGRDTPAALYASPNQPATPLDDTKRDPNDDFLKTHGLRSDTLLCLHLDGDTLPNFSSFGPLLSDNLVKIPALSSPAREPSSVNLSHDKLVRGITCIETRSWSFPRDLRERWPDLKDRLEEVLKGRAVEWHDRDYPDYAEFDDAVLPIVQIDFLHDAETVIWRRTAELSGSGLERCIRDRETAMEWVEAERRKFEEYNALCLQHGYLEDVQETFDPGWLSIVPFRPNRPQYT
ncbi:hypothetical protein NBRC10512v2_001833 [Rhodotorula toruloides]